MLIENYIYNKHKNAYVDSTHYIVFYVHRRHSSAEALRECERKLAASQSAMQRVIRDQLCITGWLEEAKRLQAKRNSDVSISCQSFALCTR